MNTRWFLPEHRDPEKKRNFEAAILNSTVLTNRLVDILDDMSNELDRFEDDVKNYDGDWAAKQAFVNGRRKQIREIKMLLNFG